MFVHSLRLIAVFALLSTGAFGSAIDVSFASSLLNAAPGQTVTFSATLTNTTVSPIYLNGDAVNAAAGLILDDSPFLLGFPLSLGAAAAASGPILSVTVATGTSFGLYTGNFEILGGSTPLDFAPQGSATFAVNVVPEPGSLMLVTSSCSLLWIVRRRLRRHNTENASRF